jgi:hypothetical protein
VSVSQPTIIASGRSSRQSCASQFAKPEIALYRIVFGPP